MADFARLEGPGAATLFVLAGAALSVVNAGFAHALGLALFPDYTLLHPFRGGIRHVVPQAIGWWVPRGLGAGE
jgi:hypothetical protein